MRESARAQLRINFDRRRAGTEHRNFEDFSGIVCGAGRVTVINRASIWRKGDSEVMTFPWRNDFKIACASNLTQPQTLPATVTSDVRDVFTIGRDRCEKCVSIRCKLRHVYP